MTDELTEEGVASFSTSFDSLEAAIKGKREQLAAGNSAGGQSSLGGLEPQVREGLRRAQTDNVSTRIWQRDPSLWKQDEASQKSISGSLGWLDAVNIMQQRASEITGFAEKVRDDGFTSVVLLGMGGSSLAPEVISRLFGPQRVGLASSCSTRRSPVRSRPSSVASTQPKPSLWFPPSRAPLSKRSASTATSAQKSRPPGR